MTALVTGASGFVGRHLATQLVSQGKTVRALVRSPDAELAAVGVECVVGDLGNERSLAEATRGVATTYHLAATMLGGSGDLWGTNVDGTRHLMQACVANRVGRVVFVSSVTAYRPPLASVVDEDAATGGLELYGRSKAEAETIVHDVCGGRVDHVILRPCQIYGPGDRSGYTSRLQAIVSRKYVPVGRGASRFSLVHVADVVDAIEAAGIEPAAAGGVFNIAGPSPISLQDLAAGARGKIVIPRTALRAALAARWLAAAAGNTNVRPFVRSYAPNSVHGSMWLGGPEYSTARARATLGFAPEMFPAEALRRPTGPNSG